MATLAFPPPPPVPTALSIPGGGAFLSGQPSIWPGQSIRGIAALETSPVFGQGYVYTLSGPGGSAPAFLLIIGGQNRNPYYALEAISLRLNRQLGSRSTASFTLKAQRGGTLYRPSVGDPVTYLHNGVVRFTGTVESRREKWIAGQMAEEISCNDWGVLLSRKVINRPYLAAGFDSLKSVVRAIVRDKLAADGFTFNESSTDVDQIGDQPFQGITVQEAFSRLTQQTGMEYWIDADKAVTFFDPAGGTGAASFTLTDDDGHVIESPPAELSEDRGLYRNVQYIALSKPSDGLQRETHIVGNDAAAPTIKLTSVPSARPNYENPVILGPDRAIDIRVYVNGVRDTPAGGRDVTMAGDWVDPYRWWYITEDVGGVQELSNAIRRTGPLDPGDEVVVTYPTEEVQDPLVRVADVSQIAARQAIEGGSGIYEAIEQVQGVEDYDTAVAIATALLSRYGHIPKTLSFSTDHNWLSPGELLSVNLTEPLVSGDFLIAGVQSVEMSGLFMRHAITCVVGSRQIDDMTLIQRIIAANRKPRDRNREIATLVLAKTLRDPDTGEAVNFGLQAGENITDIPWSIQQTGVVKEVRARFTTPNTNNDVTIDVLVGGVSILEPDKLVIPVAAGSPVETNEVVLRNFSQSPMRVDKNAKITVNVNTADQTAKDGYVKVEITS